MIGQSLAHYKVLEKLGSGGMGEVYLAADTRLDRKVALKILPAEVASDPERLARFEREAKAVAALNHPNIVTIYSVEEAGGRPFLTMEVVEGQTLAERIPDGGMSLDELFGVAIPLADAVSSAHQRGIVHRDLKPGNVMISREGRVKILDFGLAKLRRGAESGVDREAPTQALTEVGGMVGTVPYMSPEQLQGKAVDQRSDLFSLGVMLYEMATGERPFRGETPADVSSSILRDTPKPVTSLRRELPRHLGRIVQHCLEKDPERRLESARDLRTQLEGLRQEAEASREELAPSIAVLPFTDMSPQRDQDYFCEGIAEELINALAKVEGIRVASRTSAFQFQGTAADIREIGERLNVKTVLEGSVRKAGDYLRITAQLVNVADGYHLWSDRYDREMKDVFAIQDEIARSIVEALRVTLSPKEKEAIQKAPTRSVEAYDYYLRGRKFFYRRTKEHPFAHQMFTRAIEIDPGYARAWAGLADACSFLYMYYSREDKLEEADRASRKAVELEPGSAEARASRALALSLNKRFEEAEGEFETALKLDPSLFEAYYFYGRCCWAQGALEKAARLFEQAAAVRPEEYQPHGLLVSVYRSLGRDEERKAAAGRCLEAAEKHLELNPDDARAAHFAAGALQELGRQEEALEWAERVTEMDPEDPSILYNVACLYSLAGRTEEAITSLERAVELGYAHREWIEHDGDFDPIRNHPRFGALLERM